MRIKKITYQNRRDFTAIMICEHCGDESENTKGYDDAYYHDKVIPGMKCPACKKTGAEAKGDDYRPLAPRYSEEQVV